VTVHTSGRVHGQLNVRVRGLNVTVRHGRVRDRVRVRYRVRVRFRVRVMAVCRFDYAHGRQRTTGRVHSSGTSLFRLRLTPRAKPVPWGGPHW